jgi:hypothetical protein
MATLHCEGIEGLALSLEEFQKIPDSVVEEMLQAGGKVVADAQRAELRSLGLVHSGKLAQSIEIHLKSGGRDNGNRCHAVVYPEGSNHSYRSRVKTRAYKRSKHGRTYTVGGGRKTASNAEVGFIQNYGAPGRGIAATNWMEHANEKSADACVQAMTAVYEAWLASLDL